MGIVSRYVRVAIIIRAHLALSWACVVPYGPEAAAEVMGELD